MHQLDAEPHRSCCTVLLCGYLLWALPVCCKTYLSCRVKTQLGANKMNPRVLYLISSGVYFRGDSYQAKWQNVSSIQYHIDGGTPNLAQHPHRGPSFGWNAIWMKLAWGRDSCGCILFPLSDSRRLCAIPSDRPEPSPSLLEENWIRHLTVCASHLCSSQYKHILVCKHAW